MKNILKTLLFILVTVMLVSCGKEKPKATVTPNSEVTYDKGADLTGAVKKIDKSGGMVTFYNPVLDSEETFIYNSATSIQSKHGEEMVMDQVEPGEVYDLYVDDVGSGLVKMKQAEGLIEETDATVFPDSDSMLMSVDGVNYSYSQNMVALSGDRSIDPMEITAMDRVTFRGVKGKAYSVIVTRGHGYVEPVEYGDFVGGTLTIEGEAILPITEGMLVMVPEGKQTIFMKNGDLQSKADTQVERSKVSKLNMKETMSQVPNTARVSFHIYPEGAELYVNGTMVDYTKSVPMYYGTHVIKVVLEGYNDYQGTISVKDPEPSFRIDLAEEVASVEDTKTDETQSQTETPSSTVNDDDGTIQTPSSVDYDVDHTITVSSPEGASVYINGTYKGVAPCKFTKCIGQITLTLQKEGYQTKSYSLDIIDDSQDTSLSFPDLGTAESAKN